MNTVWINGFEQISYLGVGVEVLENIKSYGSEYWRETYPYALIGDSFDFHAVTGREESFETRQMDQLTRYLVACAQLLLGKELINSCALIRERAGIILGSAFGCTSANHTFLETLLSAGPRRTSPVVFRNTVSNAAAGHLAIAFRFIGSNSVINNGTVSGLQALAYAFDEITAGHSDLVLTGAGDWVSELICKRFLLHGGRQGDRMLPLMDGACMLTLSSDLNSSTRGWQVLGYGMGFMHNREREACFIRIVRKALERANISSEDVDVIQIMTDRNIFWIRSSPYETLEAASAQLLQKMPSLPIQENTAIPVMISLIASLICFPKKRIPDLFTDSDVPSLLERIPKYTVFAAIGSDGNITVLVLHHV